MSRSCLVPINRAMKLSMILLKSMEGWPSPDGAPLTFLYAHAATAGYTQTLYCNWLDAQAPRNQTPPGATLFCSSTGPIAFLAYLLAYVAYFTLSLFCFTADGSIRRYRRCV